VTDPEVAPVTTGRMAELYAEVLRRLEGTASDRHGRFMNFGYRPLPGEVPAGPALPPRLPSRDSAQLTLEVVGDTDLSGRVLEVGCGRGGNLWLLHRLLGVRQVVGVDLVPRAVAFAQRDNRAEHHLFLAGDAERLPIASASVDVVLNVESSSTYADPEAFFRGVARVLRPGGTFLHADLLPTEIVPVVRRVCTDLGLEEVHHRDISANVAASSVLRDGRGAFGFDAAPAALDPLDPTGHRYVISRFVARAAEVPPSRLLSETERALWDRSARVGEALLVHLLDDGLDNWLDAGA
jgi:SAM-dependent methyltransferase